MLLSPRKTPRAVSKVPYKVLDAPELADDFYLNLVDWGSQNILGVGLGQSVYMWKFRLRSRDEAVRARRRYRHKRQLDSKGEWSNLA